MGAIEVPNAVSKCNLHKGTSLAVYMLLSKLHVLAALSTPMSPVLVLTLYNLCWLAHVVVLL